MYTKCIQDVCIRNLSNILTSFCIHFVYKIKRTMPTKLCIYTKCRQKFVELWDTFCIQTFCIHFVYKSLSKCWMHFVYKFCIQTFCIHFVYINSVLQKVFIFSLYFIFLCLAYLTCVKTYCTQSCVLGVSQAASS